MCVTAEQRTAVGCRAEAAPGEKEGSCSFAGLPSFLLRGGWSLGQGGRRRWRVPSPAGTDQKTFLFSLVLGQ